MIFHDLAAPYLACFILSQTLLCTLCFSLTNYLQFLEWPCLIDFAYAALLPCISFYLLSVFQVSTPRSFIPTPSHPHHPTL